MVKCDNCQHEWDTLDPFGCCPKCRQPLSLLLNGHPSPHIHSPAKLILDEKTRIVESLFQQGLISQKDMNTLLMCDSFKQHVIPADLIASWLRLNQYRHDPTTDSYTKLHCPHVPINGYMQQITQEEIINHPVEVIDRVEEWHKKHNLFYSPWQWDDEHTRKIDIDEFYGKKKDGKPDPAWCNHEWVKYTGLNETFEYCKKCDIKRDKK